MTGGCQQRYCTVCFVRLNGGGSVFCSEGGGDCAAFLLAWFRPSKQSTCRLRAAHGTWACFPTPVSFDSARIAAHTRTILDTFSTSLPDEGHRMDFRKDAGTKKFLHELAMCLIATLALVSLTGVC